MDRVNNHIKAVMLHPLKDQKVCSFKALKFKHLKYTGKNIVKVGHLALLQVHLYKGHLWLSTED